MQREDQPIILTGYSALNKLLGREVYTSHMQVGGGVGVGDTPGQASGGTPSHPATPPDRIRHPQPAAVPPQVDARTRTSQGPALLRSLLSPPPPNLPPAPVPPAPPPLLQLGGPKVMGVNGVSHHIVEDDLAGVACVLRWLAYTPARTGEPPAPLPTADPAGRAVDYCPAEGVC